MYACLYGDSYRICAYKMSLTFKGSDNDLTVNTLVPSHLSDSRKSHLPVACIDATDDVIPYVSFQ